jgi:glycosyltransferase involved in cell wall biosynthesis
MKNILVIESGRSGYGGSFQSLYMTINSLNVKNYHFIVIFFNPTVFYDKLVQIGVECYYINDVIFSGEQNWKKYILGKLNGFFLKMLPLFSVWIDFLIHIKTIYKLLLIARKRKIDIIHLNNQLVLNFVGLFIAKYLKVPCVAHLRTFNSYGLNQYKVAYSRKINIHYIAVSEKIKRHWIERGLDSDMIEVLHNVFQSNHDSKAENKDTSLIMEYDGYKLVFVGRLIECKGISFLIEGFKMVLNSGIKAKLYLVGSGEEENRLKEIVCCQELEEEVVFLGYSDNPLAIIKMMDLLVLPSKEEGFGRVLLEAMDAGIAVIGTKVGGIPEIIDNEVNGLLVPYGDVLALKEAILRILNNEVLKQRIINAGFYTIQSKFNIEHYSDKLKDMYEAML